MSAEGDSGHAQQKLLRYLRRRVADLTRQVYADQHTSLGHVALQLLYAVDDEDAQAACGFASRGGLQAFWQDETEGRIVLLRSRYRADAKARLEARGPVGLAALWTQLNEPESTTPRSLSAATAALRQARTADPRLAVELLYVIAGTVTLPAAEQADTFNREHASESIQMRLVDLAQLQEADLQRRSLEAGPITEPITLQLREYFQEPQQGGVPTLVASIEGSQLAAIEQQYRFRIFQSNVRYQLPGKINENIDRTLKQAEGRRNFWYYNNGISIVCDEYDLDPVSKTVRVHNLQIVNGCQTTTTLSANAANLTDPASVAVVLVRLIASKDTELQRAITIFNNKQNAVKDRDLLSNDSHQERLQAQFGTLDPPWFYERKRGSWKAEVTTKERRQRFAGRIINNEKAAQSAYAFHYDPGEARARKRLLFVTRADDPNGFYDRLFTDATTPEWLLVPFIVNQYVLARKNEYTRELGALPERPAESRSVAEKLLIQRNWIKFADQAVIGTIAFYWRSRVEVTQPTLQALLAPELLETKLLPPSYALALKDLTPFFASRQREHEQREETFVAANYLKGNWSEIRDHLSIEEDYRISTDADPFAGLPVLGAA